MVLEISFSFIFCKNKYFSYKKLHFVLLLHFAFLHRSIVHHDRNYGNFAVREKLHKFAADLRPQSFVILIGGQKEIMPDKMTG